MKTPQRDPREGVYRIEGPVSSSVDGTFAGGFHAVFYGVPADPLATNRALYYQIDYNGSLPRRGTSFEATLRTASVTRPPPPTG
jgi:hypothetical protein